MALTTVREHVAIDREEIGTRIEPEILTAVMRQFRGMLPGWIMEHFDPETWPTLTSAKPLDKLSRPEIDRVRLRTGKFEDFDSLTKWVHRKVEIADSLFEMYVTVLRSMQYEYIYGGLPSTGVFCSEVFNQDATVHEVYRGNCQQLAKNFLFLLTYFGFDAHEVRFEAAPPPDGLDKPGVRMLAKPQRSVSQQDVKTYVRGRRREISENGDTRGFKLNKRFWGSYDVKPDSRDPFTTHWIADLSAFGLPYGFYDPLEGKKYRNGMSDAYDEYHLLGQYPYRGTMFKVYQRLEDPRCRLYELPENMQFSNSTYQRVKIQYSHLESLWLIVDPEDWGSASKRPGAMQLARDRKIWFRHPPQVAELYGLPKE